MVFQFDPSKVHDLLDLKALAASDIRSFLRIAIYYHHFIPEFSKLAKPMIELVKKDVKFNQTEKCETAY
jgi:hypothetical protein